MNKKSLLVERISTTNTQNIYSHNAFFLYGTDREFICWDKFDVLFPSTNRIDKRQNNNCFICLSNEKPSGILKKNLAKIKINRNRCPFTIIHEKNDGGYCFLTSILYCPLEDMLLTFFNENLPWKDSFEGYVYLTKTHPITKKRIRK